LRLLDRHGCTAPDGGLTLPFRLSQEELGQMVGITREAVGRFLRAWEREGLVDLAYAQLVVRRREALEQRSLGPRTPAPSGAPGAKTSRS
jgi:CRP-like cAMP-binding protein